MKEKFLVLFLLVLLSYVTEKIHVKCNKRTVWKELFSFVHHIISVWLIFGTFIFNKFHLFHLIAITIVFAHWHIMESATGVYGCYLSRLYNDVCGLPREKKFVDMFSVLDSKTTLILYILVVLYDMYFISNTNI